MRKPLLIIAVLLLVAFAAWFIPLYLRTPSNDRDWAVDQQVLPYAEFQGSTVNIHNIRNFTYRTETDYTPGYYDKTFDLTKIKNVYYVVEPFSQIQGPAHTFLSFEFEGNNFVSISVEVRKRVGEKFEYVKSFYHGYELMFVIADERDVVKLRSNFRHDLVYVYPIKSDKEGASTLFRNMVERANKLKAEPEFYNILTNTCTTNIVDEVNKISPKRIPYSFAVFAPGYSDKEAYDLGLIDTDLSFEAARAKYLINDRAKEYADSPDFSVKIRE